MKTIWMGLLLVGCSLSSPSEEDYFDEVEGAGGTPIGSSGGGAGVASGEGGTGAWPNGGSGGATTTGGAGGSDAGGSSGVGGLGGSSASGGSSGNGGTGGTGGAGGTSGSGGTGGSGGNGGVGGSGGNGGVGGSGGTGGCVPSCAGQECGLNTCGTYSCGSCGSTQTCNASNQCVLDCGLQQFTTCNGDAIWLGTSNYISNIYTQCPSSNTFQKYNGSAWEHWYVSGIGIPGANDDFFVNCGDTVKITP